MKIRAHRGSIDEAMRHAEEIEPTIEAVIDYMTRHTDPLIMAMMTDFRVMKHPWGDGADPRIGWDRTMFVMATSLSGDHWPMGFTDGPLAADPPSPCPDEPQS